MENPNVVVRNLGLVVSELVLCDIILDWPKPNVKVLARDLYHAERLAEKKYGDNWIAVVSGNRVVDNEYYMQFN